MPFTRTYLRKQTAFEAVQIVIENIEDVADWCKGKMYAHDTIRLNETLASSYEFEGFAYESDWIVWDGKVFRSYRSHEFEALFDPAPSYKVTKQNVMEILNELVSELSLGKNPGKMVNEAARKIAVLDGVSPKSEGPPRRCRHCRSLFEGRQIVIHEETCSLR